MKSIYCLSIIIIFSIQIYSQDTFSICAVDTITGEVGSAGASCIGDPPLPGGCSILSDVHPGIGVIHTQAYWNQANQDYASQLMDMGLPPQQIIDSLVENDIQNNPHIRQYGIIDIFEGSPRMAAYTGVNCDDYKNHIIGPNYTIQGNILLGQEILDSMEARFLNTEGELVCELMAALQGAKVIGADTRCFSEGVSSLSSFLRVAHPDDPEDDLYVDFIVPSTPQGIDPIDVLQEMVDDWGGCTNTDINDDGNNDKLLIKPNPTSEFVIISLTSRLNNQIEQINIMDLSGKVVLNNNNSNQNTVIKLQLNTLTKGLYFIIIETNQKVFYEKLIIK